MKKLLKLTALIISLVLALSCVSCSHGGKGDDKEEDFPSMGALKSLKAVEGVPQVYTAEFEGEYFLEDTIKANLKTASELLMFLKNHVRTWEADESKDPIKINVQGAACSSIVAENADDTVGGYIYGRNFDWAKGPSLILHTKPTKGYESVSTCFLPFVSLNENWAPNNRTDNNLLAISCIYVPMDGMNEKGLYIANLNNDYDAILPDTSDTTETYVQTTVAIRYILDKCATVDEAVDWLKTIVMCPVYGDMTDENGEAEYCDYHFAIADNTGASVDVEWVNGQLVKIKTQILTNHSLERCQTHLNDFDYREDNYKDPNYPEDDEWKEYSVPRFMRLKAASQDDEGNLKAMTKEEIRAALSTVQQKYSVWTAVFEPSAKRITYYFRNADPESVVEDKTDENALHVARHHPIDYTKPVVVQF